MTNNNPFLQEIEQKLCLLEAWIEQGGEGDGDNEDLLAKRNEYLCIYEEIEILLRKMRKIQKLLADPNQPSCAKLEKKQDKYLGELQDIEQYIEDDDFFLEDGRTTATTLQLLQMSSSSLLGKPLETLVEMPGQEDSSFSQLTIPRDLLLGGSNRNLWASHHHFLDVVDEHNDIPEEERTNKASEIVAVASDIVAVLSPRRRNDNNNEDSNSEALPPPPTSIIALTSPRSTILDIKGR
jgi:hypothetical protein